MRWWMYIGAQGTHVTRTEGESVARTKLKRSESSLCT